MPRWSHRRALRRPMQWAALLALLLATLSPSVAHALRHLRGERMPWSQLCSATGARRIVFEQPTASGQTAAVHAFEHCTYCALHHDGFAPPADTAVLPLRGDLSLASLPRASRNGAPHAVWPTAPPRGPPATA